MQRDGSRFRLYLSQIAMTENDYDTVELRGGRLHKIRRAEARRLGEEDGMVTVAKCYWTCAITRDSSAIRETGVCAVRGMTTA
jgi:hypothetical protein